MVELCFDRGGILGGCFGEDLSPIDRLGIEVAADVNQRAARLCFQPGVDPLDRRDAWNVEIVRSPNDDVRRGFDSRRQFTFDDNRVASFRKQIGQHRQPVDAGLKFFPSPCP